MANGNMTNFVYYSRVFVHKLDIQAYIELEITENM